MKISWIWKSWNGLELEFEWDERKDKTNKIKHGVSFEEAATVFDDPLSLNFDDPEHSRGEERYITPIQGWSATGSDEAKNTSYGVR